jgi:hypothetical protein
MATKTAFYPAARRQVQRLVSPQTVIYLYRERCGYLQWTANGPILILERQHRSDAILNQQHDPVVHLTHALGQERFIHRDYL